MARIPIADLDDPRIAIYRSLMATNQTRGLDRFVVEGEKLVERLLESRSPAASVPVTDRFEPGIRSFPCATTSKRRSWNARQSRNRRRVFHLNRLGYHSITGRGLRADSNSSRSRPSSASPDRHGAPIAGRILFDVRRKRPLRIGRRRRSNGARTMDRLVRRFKGRTTGEGHELVVTEKPNVISIGFRHSGAYNEAYDQFVNVARFERTGEAYRVGWYYDDGEEPSTSSEFTREEELVAAVDKAIEQRSKEVGATDD
jgi:hypothetical protein